MLRARVSVVCVFYVCDENKFFFIFFFSKSLFVLYLVVVDWESFIVWIVRITHLVFHFILFVFFFS